MPSLITCSLVIPWPLGSRDCTRHPTYKHSAFSTDRLYLSAIVGDRLSYIALLNPISRDPTLLGFGPSPSSPCPSPAVT